MSEINVISRTQQIIIDPASRVVAVVNNPGKSSVPTAGIPVVSGLVHRGTVSSIIPPGAQGGNILLDPTAGQLQKVGIDVEIVDAGANTYQMRVKQTGLYHISGNARVNQATPPTGGSLLGLRVNGNCVQRQTFDSSFNVISGVISGPFYLNRDDLVSLFGYSTGGNMTIDVAAQSTIDPYTPTLSVWRVSTVQLVS
ncbi:MAG: hypothetical protein ABW007_10070 [Chitinophagaceae bacterium]